jgi:hypothetical protein
VQPLKNFLLQLLYRKIKLSVETYGPHMERGTTWIGALSEPLGGRITLHMSLLACKVSWRKVICEVQFMVITNI